VIFAGAEQVGEDGGWDGVAVVEVAVDPAALFAEAAFQFPKVRGFPDPRDAFLSFPEDGIKFASEGAVEDSASGGVSRRGPLPLSHRGCRRAVYACHARFSLAAF
jgi:hypothetical protein